ncbi:MULTISPECIES: RDD family protein [unclassified Sphingobacterium]|uniref:RDD family protein n=1 Tax=unclassified Sphingobacterium TaxID=2609468 RepID=UPI00105341C6|nr:MULTISPECIES: RDD family protein [unclassified Sphingobacterium]MCS3555670.1 putative RDD family membrane protein YckC [Sphingobacterium sp. JUb21]TCR00877.1 putative RDD family membrane protein YckC [Sphingobacterium sp. JUb20]
MNKLLISTPQNVKIEYNLASLGSRIIAFAIDYFIILVYYILIIVILDSFHINMKDSWLFFGILSLLSLPALFYPLVMETAMAGQSIGKKIMKIKVVKIDGTRANFYQYFARWTFSLVDIWMCMGGIAITSIALSKYGQRIGDLSAETSVISLKAKLNLQQTIFEDVPSEKDIIFPQVIKLSDQDANKVKEIYDGAVRRKDYNILLALTQKLENILDVKSTMHPNDFVNQVMKDHYILFRNK